MGFTNFRKDNDGSLNVEPEPPQSTNANNDENTPSMHNDKTYICMKHKDHVPSCEAQVSSTIVAQTSTLDVSSSLVGERG